MSRLRGYVLSAAALLLATPATALAGAGEGVGYRLTGQPGSNLQGGFIRLSASPGSTVTASFIASNTTKNAVSVSFFGADGETTQATGAVFGSSNPTKVGNWITPSRRTATLAPNSELPIDVTVRVSPSAGPGDHVGAVIMQQNEGSSTATVKQVVRYAIPLLMDIGGGPGPAIQLGEARLGRIPGTEIATVVLPMRNTGNRICRPIVAANVAGSATAPQTVQRQLDEILPGDKIDYPLRLTDTMPGGTYLVRADVAGCGPPVSTSSSATLESKDSGAGTPPGNGGDGNKNTTGSGDIEPVPLQRGGDRDSGKGGGNGGKSSKDDGAVDGTDDDGTDDDEKAAAPVAPKGGDDGKGGWFKRAGQAIADKAPEVLERGAVPIGASALIGLLFFLQNALDRRDPKLAGAPRERDKALRFDPNPLHS